MANETKKPHVHAECIKAWADGAIIQWEYNPGDWRDLQGNTPTWGFNNKYRIKPEPKPDVVAFSVVHNVYYDENTVYVSNAFKKNEHPKSNLKLIFDGETGKLKDSKVIG